MRTWSRTGKTVAIIATSALALAACGGGGDGDGSSTGGAKKVVYQNADPEKPLLPTNTNESSGLTILENMFTPLVNYDLKTYQVKYDGVAESIKSDNNIDWTIKLKPDWTFHDGTKVTSDSFIKAWNYAAYAPNAQGNSSFFDKIAGYKDVAPEGKGVEPTAKEMSGLKKVSDTEFTVKLSNPFFQFPVTLGYAGFAPLPEAFYKSPEDFGKRPIGNGPFKAKNEYIEGEGITLVRFDEFKGKKPAISEVHFKPFRDIKTAYMEAQAGNVDISTVPPDSIKNASKDFNGRFVDTPSSAFTYLGFPMYDERFKDVRVRKALSMAIDRNGINESVFAGTRKPASGLLPAVVPGSRDKICKSCELNVDEANKLLDEAKFDREKPITLWYNAGAGHDEWVKAVGDQWSKNLKVKFELNNKFQFNAYLPELKAKRATGPYRAAWLMDYPSAQNYLEPIFTIGYSGSGANNMFYDNPKVKELITKGNEAKSPEETTKAYHEAEDMILADMPVIPMFWARSQFVHSDRVSNVQTSAFGRVDLIELTAK